MFCFVSCETQTLIWCFIWDRFPENKTKIQRCFWVWESKSNGFHFCLFLFAKKYNKKNIFVANHNYRVGDGKKNFRSKDWWQLMIRCDEKFYLKKNFIKSIRKSIIVKLLISLLKMFKKDWNKSIFIRFELATIILNN